MVFRNEFLLSLVFKVKRAMFNQTAYFVLGKHTFVNRHGNSKT